jgi:hypothetical protein
MPSKVVRSAIRPPNAGKGRVKGVPNKVTKAVKEMVIAALNKAGGVDYLVEQADKNPNAFLSLVGKVLPLQLTGEDGGPVRISRIELVAPGHE